MPSPRMPASPREAPEHRPRRTPCPCASVRLAESPPGPAVERDLHPGGGLDRRSPARPGTLWSSSGSSSSVTSCALAVGLAVQRAVRRHQRARAPSRAARRASRRSSTPAIAESGRWRTRHGVDPAAAPSRHCGGSKRGGHALAPRRAAQPGQVDHVGLLGQLSGPLDARLAGSGSLTESISTTWDRCSRASTASWWPCGAQTTVAMSVTTSGSTIVSSFVRCFVPDVEHDPLARQGELAGAVVLARRRERHGGVDRRAARLDRAQDRARRVVAADVLEPVEDLAAPLAVDHHHEVEHPRGRERLVLRGTARRAARAAPPRSPPGVVSCALQTAPASTSDRPPAVAAARAARRPPPGPACRPRSVASGVRPPAQPSRIGSMMRHCASTSSSRVNSVASPRMASMIRRS